MIPANDISKAKAEDIITIKSLDKLANILCMYCKFRELVCFADLRVCDNDKVVICVILSLLLYNKIISIRQT